MLAKLLKIQRFLLFFIDKNITKHAPLANFVQIDRKCRKSFWQIFVPLGEGYFYRRYLKNDQELSISSPFANSNQYLSKNAEFVFDIWNFPPTFHTFSWINDVFEQQGNDR